MKMTPAYSNTPELSRLVAAAVVSPEFRHLLLTNAAQALERGYNGTSFGGLSAGEQALILSISATSLAEFAAQLVNGQGEGAATFGRERRGLLVGSRSMEVGQLATGMMAST